jgi:hypothetical protein
MTSMTEATLGCRMLDARRAFGVVEVPPVHALDDDDALEPRGAALAGEDDRRHSPRREADEELVGAEASARGERRDHLEGRA